MYFESIFMPFQLLYLTWQMYLSFSAETSPSFQIEFTDISFKLLTTEQQQNF